MLSRMVCWHDDCREFEIVMGRLTGLFTTALDRPRADSCCDSSLSIVGKTFSRHPQHRIVDLQVAQSPEMLYHYLFGGKDQTVFFAHDETRTEQQR